MIGSKFIGEIDQKTNIRYKKSDDCENYYNVIDVDYDSEDVFAGWMFRLNTPELNKGTDLNMVEVQTLNKILLNV